ncbi:MAG TPA: sugar phosphate isomerase/epimerase family protein [Bryobacteraceae bacterium]|nr:sugar phosphate isomerase/epimerase family protein [Bryobacteraceae bacterium]HXR77764.1 sugar phosphate isomerase/epimerase family protein [Bryobacteraceae bacterium]
MTDMTRRGLLKSTLVAGATARIAFAKKDKIRIGVTDWNLDRGADPESVPLAARLGFEGVQVSFGQKLIDGKMPADNPETIARYLKLSKDNNIPIDGACVDRLHTDGLKSTKAGQKWVLDSIRLTKDLHTKVLLLPFFGKWALKNREEMDHTGDVLRDLAPEAEKAGVILGLEDTISAEDNVRIMDRARSKNVLVYYDVGNSTNNGFDVVKEIRWLGKDRICQFHFKDNPHFLGDGKIQFAPIIHAIRDIGYSGYANLETDAGKNTLEADMRRNLLYIRDVMAHA